MSSASVPFFSIITATYNAADVLPCLLASLESQTCQDFVWVCQDGASADDTLAIAKEWEGKIATSIASEKDTGVYDAWNKAIAREGDRLGEWVIFLGADDLLASEDVLERVKKILSTQPQSIILACGELLFIENTSNLRYRSIDKNRAFKKFPSEMTLPHPALFTRSRALLDLPFSIKYKIVSDYDWLKAAWKKEAQLCVMPILTTFMSLGGISSNPDFRKKLLLERIDVLRKHPARNLKERLLFPYYWYLLYREIMQKNFESAKSTAFLLRKYYTWKMAMKNKIITFMVKVANKIYSLSNLKKDIEHLKVQKHELKAQIALSNSSDLPVLKEFREKRLIVSLTTYPARSHKVDTVIYSILSQSILPDKILLWLSNEEYPRDMESVPQNIKKLQQYGVEILFCENIKPYKKLIPTLELYPNDIIVTADDDVYYPREWLKLLYTSYLNAPHYIHAHRVHKITFDEHKKINSYNKFLMCIQHTETKPSFLNFFTSGGGVICSPNSLHNDITRKEIFTKLTPNADDIWFWAMAVMQDTKINVVENNIANIIDLNMAEQSPSLWEINHYKNDEQMQNVLRHYPEINEKIQHSNI